VPLTPLDANNMAFSGSTAGNQSFLNGACGGPSANNGWEVRKATLAEIGLPATIATPLQFPN
jgi:hypothetical protein